MPQFFQYLDNLMKLKLVFTIHKGEVIIVFDLD